MEDTISRLPELIARHNERIPVLFKVEFASILAWRLVIITRPSSLMHIYASLVANVLMNSYNREFKQIFYDLQLIMKIIRANIMGACIDEYPSNLTISYFVPTSLNCHVTLSCKYDVCPITDMNNTTMYASIKVLYTKTNIQKRTRKQVEVIVDPVRCGIWVLLLSVLVKY